MKKLKQELEERGLLYQNSNDSLFDMLDKGGVNFYCGFDPTANSLHLGNFIGFMVSVHIMRRGNKFTALTGGATSMIGDPGGKDSERNFLSIQDLDKNQESVANQMTKLLKNLSSFTGENFKFDFINNKDFYTDMRYLDFLREVGKYITVNVMINKDSVKNRIKDTNKSISYTEFSYMLLQGYDFAKLFCDNNVKIQIGGQDQWGNLVTGVELIRKKYDDEAYVSTWPLIVDSSGKKFGKSEGNALWLDKNKTSAYELYQYFMNTSDDDLKKYLRMLTLIEIEKIDEIVKKHMVSPEKRDGQSLLAFKVVEIIHGEKEARGSKNISDLVFGGQNAKNLLKIFSKDDMELIFNGLGGFKYNKENLFESIVKSGLASSNSEARKLIQSGSICINEEKLEKNEISFDFEKEFLKEKFILIRKGKKNFKIIKKY